MRIAALVLMAAAIAGAAGVPWVEDDYARALKEARARKTPLFVEVWAPW